MDLETAPDARADDAVPRNDAGRHDEGRGDGVRPGRFARFLGFVQDLAETGLAMAKTIRGTLMGLAAAPDRVPGMVAERAIALGPAFIMLNRATSWAVALHARLLTMGEAALWGPEAAAPAKPAARRTPEARERPAPLPGLLPGLAPLLAPDRPGPAAVEDIVAWVAKRPVANVIARIRRNLCSAARTLGRTDEVRRIEAMLAEMTALLAAGPEAAPTPQPVWAAHGAPAERPPLWGQARQVRLLGALPVPDTG